MSITTNTDNKNIKTAWVDIVWYLSDIAFFTKEKLNAFSQSFGKITIASNQNRPNSVPKHIEWLRYEKEDSRVSVWNDALIYGNNKWKLFLIDDETLRISELDSQIKENNKEWPATLIHHRGSEKNYQYYQMRLINNFDGFQFDGVNLPDATRSIIRQGIALSNTPIEIMAPKNPNAVVDIEQEMAIRNYAPQLFIENGYRLFKKGKFIHAAAQYRVIANSEMVLPFDRLSALNGVATCHAEQFRWELALLAAEKSMAEEKFQHLPYLIIYKVNELNKNYEEAYDALNKYYEITFYDHLKLYSKASYDVRITIEETLISLVDLAFKAGYIEEAREHLEELFNQKKGKLDRKFLKQLLVLSIELQDFEKSEFFFKKMYEHTLDQELSDPDLSLLNDYMEMFIKNNWYETVYEVYSKLYNHYPQNDEFRRRLIVTLVKTGRVEQARNLASMVA